MHSWSRPLAAPCASAALAALLASCAAPAASAGDSVKEFSVEPRTAGNGSVWDIVLSRDPGQRWLLLADGRNNQVLTVRRDDGAVQGTLGRPGRYAGEFHWVHDLAIDSKGNLYAGEVDTGKRAQKFVRALE